MPDLLVNEVFGPVWQGEGRQAGQRCFFIRTSTCNLECTWCDTPQTWVYSDRKVTKHSRVAAPFNVQLESQRMGPQRIIDDLDALGYHRDDLIVISGGEPMLQQAALGEVVKELYSIGWADNLAVETAGTIVPEAWWENDVSFTVSPKLSGSGNASERRYNVDAIFEFKRRDADFKFVVTNSQDELEVEDFVVGHDLDRRKVWVMPEGITPEDVLQHARILASWAAHKGYNLSLRQHVLLYGDERKR